jgi:hypothetical protein
MGWQHAVDERDEFAASEEETDEDHILLQDDDDQEDDEERTSAALIAEEGRGMIVQGEGLLLSDLNVQPGACLCCIPTPRARSLTIHQARPIYSWARPAPPMLSPPFSLLSSHKFPRPCSPSISPLIF